MGCNTYLLFWLRKKANSHWCTFLQHISGSCKLCADLKLRFISAPSLINLKIGSPTKRGKKLVSIEETLLLLNFGCFLRPDFCRIKRYTFKIPTQYASELNISHLWKGKHMFGFKKILSYISPIPKQSLYNISQKHHRWIKLYKK